MQFSEMRSRLRIQIGNPSGTDVGDTTIDRHLNDAYQEIAVKYRFYKSRKLCAFSTVVGERRYNLPADCLVLYRLRDTTNEVPLHRIGDRTMATRIGRDVQGVPNAYTRYRQFVELDPTPNAIIGIEGFYKASLARLSLDADVPFLPEPWHPGIVILARYKYRDEEGDIPKAVAADAAFKNWLRDQPTEVDEEKISIDSGVSLPTLARFRRSPVAWDEE